MTLVFHVKEQTGLDVKKDGSEKRKVKSMAYFIFCIFDYYGFGSRHAGHAVHKLQDGE